MGKFPLPFPELISEHIRMYVIRRLGQGERALFTVVRVQKQLSLIISLQKRQSIIFARLAELSGFKIKNSFLRARLMGSYCFSYGSSSMKRRPLLGRRVPDITFRAFYTRVGYIATHRISSNDVNGIIYNAFMCPLGEWKLCFYTSVVSPRKQRVGEYDLWEIRQEQMGLFRGPPP